MYRAVTVPNVRARHVMTARNVLDLRVLDLQKTTGPRAPDRRANGNLVGRPDPDLPAHGLPAPADPHDLVDRVMTVPSGPGLPDPDLPDPDHRDLDHRDQDRPDPDRRVLAPQRVDRAPGRLAADHRVAVNPEN